MDSKKRSAFSNGLNLRKSLLYFPENENKKKYMNKNSRSTYPLTHKKSVSQVELPLLSKLFLFSKVKHKL